MAMPPQVASSQGSAPQGPSQSMPPQAQQGGEAQQEGDPKEAAFTNMIISTDQALTKITQVIASANPEAGKALQQVNEQFRNILQGVMDQEDKGESQGPAPAPVIQPKGRGKRSAPQMAPQVSGGGRAVSPAY